MNRNSSNSIWLRTWSHMASQCSRGSMTTLDDVGVVLGRPLDPFFWTLTISWSRLLARGVKWPLYAKSYDREEPAVSYK